MPIMAGGGRFEFIYLIGTMQFSIVPKHESDVLLREFIANANFQLLSLDGSKICENPRKTTLQLYFLKIYVFCPFTAAPFP